MAKRMRSAETQCDLARSCYTMTVSNAHRISGQEYDYEVRLPREFEGLNRIRVTAQGSGSSSRVYFLQFRANCIAAACTTELPGTARDGWVTVMPMGIYEPQSGVIYAENMGGTLAVRYIDEDGIVVQGAGEVELLVCHIERIA